LEVGRVPRGLARVADIRSEQKGLEAKLRTLEIAHRIFARLGEVADGFIIRGGDIDRGEIPRAHQAGQWHGITAVGVHAVTGLFGESRRGRPPSRDGFFG
jgi:hypothetical protein